jgi:hypothetical protein
MGPCQDQDGTNTADSAGEDTGGVAHTPPGRIVASKKAYGGLMDLGTSDTFSYTNEMETDLTRLHGLPEKTPMGIDVECYR